MFYEIKERFFLNLSLKFIQFDPNKFLSLAIIKALSTINFQKKMQIVFCITKTTFNSREGGDFSFCQKMRQMILVWNPHGQNAFFYKRKNFDPLFDGWTESSWQPYSEVFLTLKSSEFVKKRFWKNLAESTHVLQSTDRSISPPPPQFSEKDTEGTGCW